MGESAWEPNSYRPDTNRTHTTNSTRGKEQV